MTVRVPMESPARRALGLYVLSGAVALGCETLWYRGLAVAIGSTLGATATVLTGVMCGLAAGSLAGALVADRVRSPLRAYAIAEACVGCAALATPRALTAIGHVAPSLPGALRAALAIVALVPPTFAMGITLPLLVPLVAARDASIERAVAKLYAVNLAGATTGAWTIGHLVLPREGIRRTATILAISALAVAAAASLPTRSPPREPIERAKPDPAETNVSPIALATGVGFVSFALQVAWNRAFALALGSSAYTFTLVLVAILLGNALGAARAARPLAASFWRGISRACLALGIVIFLGALVLDVAPFHLRVAAMHGGTTARAMRYVLGAVVLLPPSYLVGALFPALASRAGASRPGRAAGFTLVGTTTGNALGALVAAFVAIPSEGVAWTLTALALASFALALAAAAHEGWDRTRATGLAIVVAIAIGIALAPGSDEVARSAGTFRTSAYRARSASDAAPCGPGARFAPPRVLFHRDGALGTVVVLGHAAGPSCALYSLRVNGKAEGSVYVRAPLGDRVPRDAITIPAGDLPTEVLAGWIPGMAGRETVRAMVVGWGTGLSARALDDTGVRSLVGVDIEPAVFDAARRFDPELFTAPGVTVRVADGRIALAREPPDSLDVIASHPSNPWVAGAAGLFSREYFALARSRLRAGGRFMAWVQLYDADADVVRGLLATFVSVFPDAFAFRPRADAHDLLLLGLRTARPTTRDDLLAMLRSRSDERARMALRRAGIADVDALGAAIIASGPRLVEIARGGRLVTDDDPWIEYRVADRMLDGSGTAPELLFREVFDRE